MHLIGRRRLHMKNNRKFQEFRAHYLKVVVSIATIHETRFHTTVLETYVRSHMGTDRCAQVFLLIPYGHARPDARVLLLFPTGNPCGACCCFQI